MVGPHVCSSTFDDVALLGIVVEHRTFFERVADIDITGKNPDRFLRTSELRCDTEKDN
jgi:hypothetical protein